MCFGDSPLLELGTIWGQALLLRWLCVAGFFRNPGKNFDMASLERRNGKYRIVFRYGGQKFSRSLLTDSARTAELSLAKLEDNLARLSLGTCDVPEGVDVATFLLSDGKLKERRRVPTIRSFDKLAYAFIEAIPVGSIEASTVAGMKTHIRHLCV